MTGCSCAEDVVCGSCMTGAAAPTPPADDVREVLHELIVLHDPRGLARPVGAVSAILSDPRIEVRPRGTVTDDYEAGYGEGFHHGRSTPIERPVSETEVEAAGRMLYGVSWGDVDLCDPVLVRTALEAARAVRS